MPDTTNLTDFISLKDMSWILSKWLNGTLINFQPVFIPSTSVEPAT